MTDNPELELAWSFVNETDTNVYLTGKAGTGKTTFLHRVREETPKRVAVVAPTGVAAINAEGVTIHSMFQLPFGPILPDQKGTGSIGRKFTKRKINLLRSLDLLIIDEISMVRADVLDGIDRVLRKFRDRDKPFGGVQLLMIGDLHQLPPVVQSQEWQLLSPHYHTPYFFGSHALQRTQVVDLELEHIYRQESQEFIDLLNKVRENRMDEKVLEKLNERFDPSYQPTKKGTVTLTSHNRSAHRINSEKLQEIPEEEYRYEAEVDGDFPDHAFPTLSELTLKKGAQVMFVKNDPSEEKAFYNGKIGEITSLDKDRITVHCPEDGEEIEVGKLIWENRRFNLNEETKEISEDVIGTFKQLPIRLAWAITIHKSQGLTFENVIIDAADAFAHGQVYVALSRCRSLEGIVLRSRLEPHSIKTDQAIKEHSEKIKREQPDEKKLKDRKRAFQEDSLIEMFQFNRLKQLLSSTQKLLRKHEKEVVGNVRETLNDTRSEMDKKVFDIGNRFLKELGSFFDQETLPEENPELINRTKKAGAYFKDHLERFKEEILEIEILSDNKEVQKRVTEKKKELLKEVQVQIKKAEVCIQGFNSKKMMRSRADAIIDHEKNERSIEGGPAKGHKVKLPEKIDHKELFEELMKWRKEMCAKLELPAYRILSTRSLLEITHVLPTGINSLEKVHGVGKVKISQFGEAVLDIVKEYCASQGVTKTDRVEFTGGSSKKTEAKSTGTKKDTKQQTLELFRTGATVHEIAKKRQLATSTIESHLNHWVNEGEVDVFDLLSPEKVKEVEELYRRENPTSFSKAMEYLGEGFSYQELRLALTYLQRMKKVDPGY